VQSSLIQSASACFLVPSSVYLFGHSLGGHLLAFINLEVSGFAIAGTPLSSVADFESAFVPNKEETHDLLELLRIECFTSDEARKFITHLELREKLWKQ